MRKMEQRRGVRFSLRGLLMAIAFFAVGFAALRFANGTWWLIVSSAGLLLVMAMTVIALVGRARRRAFAGGFVACVAVYATLMYVEGEQRYGANAGKQALPTTVGLNWMYDIVKREIYLDDKSGEPLAGFDPGRAGERVLVRDDTGYYAVYDPSQPDRSIYSGSDRSVSVNDDGYVAFGGGYGNAGYGYIGYGGPVSRIVKRRTLPEQRPFMAIGHVLWGLVFGLVGGQFALFVYAQRDDRPPETAGRDVA